ncbi:MAG TPA: DUF3618 domain-containing protein [Abditibacterium sp.]|jgi:hypothetical protein
MKSSNDPQDIPHDIQNDWADLDTAGSPKPAAEPESAAQIRAEIEETRAEMSQTIDALQEKLDPQHIKAQVTEKVHDATIGRAQGLVHTAGEKLAPAQEKLSEASGKLAEAAGPAAQTAKSKGMDALRFGSRQPMAFGAIVTAILALFWIVLRRHPDTEIEWN